MVVRKGSAPSSHGNSRRSEVGSGRIRRRGPPGTTGQPGPRRSGRQAPDRSPRGSACCSWWAGRSAGCRSEPNSYRRRPGAARIGCTHGVGNGFSFPAKTPDYCPQARRNRGKGRPRVYSGKPQSTRCPGSVVHHLGIESTVAGPVHGPRSTGADGRRMGRGALTCGATCSRPCRPRRGAPDSKPPQRHQVIDDSGIGRPCSQPSWGR
jgi:hypothetical protein